MLLFFTTLHISYHTFTFATAVTQHLTSAFYTMLAADF